MKKCIKCNIEKEESLFSKCLKGTNGLQGWCKECSKKWREGNKDHLSEIHKNWRIKNRETLKEKSHNKYQENKEELKRWQKDYREKFPDKKKETDHKSYMKHVEKKKLTSAKWQAKNKVDWEGFIPIESICQMCGDLIYYNRPEYKSPICFDHRRDGKEAIQGNPTKWLTSHSRTSESEELWKSCDFGNLCFSCNSGLPTKDRTKRILNLVDYHFGNDIKLELIRIIDKKNRI